MEAYLEKTRKRLSNAHANLGIELANNDGGGQIKTATPWRFSFLGAR